MKNIIPNRTFLGALSFAVAQDADNDGVADASDCAPSILQNGLLSLSRSRWDGYDMEVTGFLVLCHPSGVTHLNAHEFILLIALI
jgi:hypothetical protein